MTNDRTPLSGKRILVTRSAEQAAALAEPLAALGAQPVLCPVIEIVPPPSYAELDAALDDLSRFDLLILTSVNAVRTFFARLHQRSLDASNLRDLVIVAVGPKTASAVSAAGATADLVPEDYRAEGVVDLLREKVAGKQVLYPKAALARDLIVSALTAAGATVVEPVAYASVLPQQSRDILNEALFAGLDLITFTASSTARNLVALTTAENRARLKSVAVASIGPLTTQTCRELGLNVVIEPSASTLEALIDAIVAYYAEA